MSFTPTTTDTEVLKAIGLLNELLSLKSKQDGVPRAAIGVLGPKEGCDEVSSDVQSAAMLLFAARQAIPLMERLADIGRRLHDQGVIEVDFDESFADKALAHLQSLLPGSPAQANPTALALTFKGPNSSTTLDIPADTK